MSRVERIEGLADLRMRISLYLGRAVPGTEEVHVTMSEVLDRANEDRAALDEMMEQG